MCAGLGLPYAVLPNGRFFRFPLAGSVADCFCATVFLAAAVSGAGARVLGAKGVVWRQNNRAVGAQRRKNLCTADYAVSARRAACISGRADSASSH